MVFQMPEMRPKRSSHDLGRSLNGIKAKNTPSVNKLIRESELRLTHSFENGIGRKAKPQAPENKLTEKQQKSDQYAHHQEAYREALDNDLSIFEFHDKH